MVQPNPRKFYSTVTVKPLEQGFGIALDEKSLRTPARAELILPNLRLAEAIAEEWRTQGEKLIPGSMPLTRLANTAVDRVVPARTEMVERIMAFGRSDQVCYRAEAPRDLVARQSQVWDPLLAWLRKTHGAELRTYVGVAFVEQPPEALQALASAVAAHDDFALAALHSAASLGGSLVIALALVAGRLDADAAFVATHVDEAYQQGKWGTDPAAQARAKRIADEFAAVTLFLALLKES